MDYGVHVEIKTERWWNDNREISVYDCRAPRRHKSQPDSDTSGVGVHRQDPPSEAVHHDALGGLHPNAGQRREVLLNGVVVPLSESGKGDLSEVVRQSVADLLELGGPLPGQTGVSDEQREVGYTRSGQAPPVRHCGL